MATIGWRMHDDFFNRRTPNWKARCRSFRSAPAPNTRKFIRKRICTTGRTWRQLRAATSTRPTSNCSRWIDCRPTSGTPSRRCRSTTTLRTCTSSPSTARTTSARWLWAPRRWYAASSRRRPTTLWRKSNSTSAVERRRRSGFSISRSTSRCVCTGGHFEGERVGMPFPLLKCLRTHYGRHCKPFSGQKLDCKNAGFCIYKIFPGVIPRTLATKGATPFQTHPQKGPCAGARGRKSPHAWTQTRQQFPLGSPAFPLYLCF